MDEAERDKDENEFPLLPLIEGPQISALMLEESALLLGKNVSLECNCHVSPPAAVEITDFPEKSARFPASVRKSSSVARDFSCFPRDAIVFWHSASFPAAMASSSCIVMLYQGNVYILPLLD